MKNFSKKLFVIFVTIFLCFNAVACNPNNPNEPATPINPPQPPTETTSRINYVSLGDSIADGSGLADYQSKDSLGFVNGSYAQLFKQKLEQDYDEVNAVNYGKSGDDSNDLLMFLTSLFSDNLSELKQSIKTNIQLADIITVCIGANDILSPATSQMGNFLIFNKEVTSHLDSGIQQLKNNFPQIINKLKILNSSANIIFLNVYNPYKELATTPNNMPTISGPLSIDSNKLKEIGIITESYLIAGELNLSSVSKTIIDGVNTIIKSNIENVSNYHLLDVKAAFDNYLSVNATYDIVNVNLLSQSSVNTSTLNQYLDPHPNAKGHELIYSLLSTLADAFN